MFSQEKKCDAERDHVTIPRESIELFSAAIGELHAQIARLDSKSKAQELRISELQKQVSTLKRQLKKQTENNPLGGPVSFSSALSEL